MAVETRTIRGSVIRSWKNEALVAKVLAIKAQQRFEQERRAGFYEDEPLAKVKRH